jgi:prepilin-type N-terminal cleavage/methylation domain-containing protein
MVRTRSRPTHGFTLVEILVVLGIIAILAALLLPAAMQVVTRARNAAIAIEVSQLADAVESYKQDKGDYPPDFRDYQAFIRHVQRCYPKINPAHLNGVVGTVWPGYNTSSPTPPAGAIPTIDEGESLVFWLSMVDNDPRLPFKWIALTSITPLPVPNFAIPPNPKKYYEFDQSRLASEEPSGSDRYNSYKAKYCKDTYYLYIDSRSYLECAQFSAYGTSVDPFGDRYASAEEDLPTTNPPTTSMVPTNPHKCARPYWSDTLIAPSGTTRARHKPANATTFQILCAGQDGEFGLYDKLETTITPDVKQFPSGFNYSDSRADHDNITNFSNGRRLEDNIPQQ